MPGEDELILSDTDRSKLDDIVGQMASNKEADDDIQFVVNDFKNKYGVKKKEQKVSPSLSPLLSSNTESVSAIGSSDSSSGLDYLGGKNLPNTTQPLKIENQQPSMRAAGTSAEITPPDQNTFDPTLAQKEIDDNPYKMALLRGTARLGNSIAKAPAFAYDIASTVTNNVINRPFGIPDAPTSEEIASNIPEEYHLTKQFDDMINEDSQRQASKYDQGINDYFFGEKSDPKKGFELIALGALESAPTTISMLLGNAAGASNASMVGAGTLAFGADKMSELERENPEASQETKVLNATTTGLAEGLGEQMFGLTKLYGLSKEVLKKSGKEAAEKLAKEAFEESYGKVIKRYVGVGAEEVISEMATQFAQNAIDKASVKPDLDLLQGVSDAGYIALGSSGPMVAPTAALDLMVTKKNRDAAAKLLEQKTALETDLTSPDVNEDAKSVISNKIKDINEQEADLAKEEKEKVASLPPEAKQQINTLQEQAHKIATAASDEAISDETREMLKKDLDDVDTQVDQIFETSKVQAEQKAVQDKADSQDEIDYLNEIKKEFGLDPDEEARLQELQSPGKSKSTPAPVNEDIQAQINQNKQDYWNEKIPYTEYRKKNDELSQQLNTPAQEVVPNEEVADAAEETPVENQTPEQELKFPEASLSDLDSKGIEIHAENVKKYLSNSEESVFGKDVDTYRKAVSDSNSQDAKVQKAGSDKLKEIDSSLSEEQKEKLYNSAPKDVLTDPKEIQAVANRVSVVEQSENVDDLSDSLKAPLLKLAKNEKDQASQVVINAIKNKAAELNLDPAELLKNTTDKISKDLPDKFDAKFLQEEVLKTVFRDRKTSTTEALQEETKTPPKTSKNELIDEEDSAPDVKDSKEAKASLDKDIEAMKQMSTKDLAEKKFVGMVERAWKAKEEGKISRPTYTEFKNKAKDILAGKVAAKDDVEATEVKLRVTAAMNKVKEKLVGQGYKKITLSSLSPITPQTVADFIDLTNKLINRGVDAGFTIADATKKAIAIVKKHPAYKKLVAAKEIDEKSFEDQVNNIPAEEKAEKKKDEPKKEKTDKKAPKKETPKEASNETDEADIFGETRKKKTAARIKGAESFKEIFAEMEEDEQFYKSINVTKANEHIDKMLNEIESQDGLEDLAQKMIEGENPFHEKLRNLSAAKLADKLRIIASKEGNEFQKKNINKLAAQLLVAKNKATNVAATQTALEAEVAKLMPISEEGLKEFTKASFAEIQENSLNEKQKKDIETVSSEMEDIYESQEFKNKIKEAVDAEVDRIAESTKGKEWVASINDTINSLKVDLKDC